MRIDLYNNGSYTVDHGWKKPSVRTYDEYFPDSTGQYSIGYNSEDIGRDAEDARREPFIWKTDKGKLLLVEDMATPHLINAIKMIWRNVFGLDNDRPEIMNSWSSAYVDRATKEFSKELQKRVEEA